MAVLSNSNPLALNATGGNYIDSNGVAHITIGGNANGSYGDDRLPSSQGLPDLYGGMSSAQANTIGTDLAGNLPTFSQLAAAGGLSDVATDTGSNVTTGSGAGNALGIGTGNAPSVPWWQDWVTRGALIILGFIFVGVGLNMFGRAGTTIAILSDGPAKAAQKAGKVATEAA